MKNQKNNRISLFPDKTTTIIVNVERPNGTTFSQRLEVELGESIKDTINNYQKQLGDPYKWVTIRGKRQRIIRKDAYLITGYYIL